MSEVVPIEKQNKKLAKENRANRKKEVRQRLARIKHRMEVTRTTCSVVGLIANLCVLSHVLGIWK